MRRPVLGTLFALAACLILIPASTSATPDIGQKNNGFSIADEKALHVYEDCWAELKAQCGRNIVDDGVAREGLHGITLVEQPSEARVKEWTATMDRWLNPPEPVASSISGVVAPAPVTTSVPTTSAGDCPAEMAGEASYSTQVNPSSGAYGCYQVIPSTAAAYNCDLSSMDGQTACMQAICAGQGNGAWAASGATPC